LSLRTSASLFLGAAIVAVLAGCGGSSSPAQPVTPTPTATPTPVTTPTPGSGLPAGMTCNPTPPPLYGFKVKFHDDTPGRAVLDSKPLVLNVDGYCAKVGSGGETQKFCDTRPEGSLERTACDYLATGKAADTGRWGPTWTWDGKPCDGANFTSCANHQTNQFMAIAKAPGRFEACVAADIPIAPDGSSCGGITVP
jgi:hypothetical protein